MGRKLGLLVSANPFIILIWTLQTLTQKKVRGSQSEKHRPMNQLQKSPCKTVRLGCFSSPHRLLFLSVMLFASCALGWLMVLYFSLPLACEREITHTTKTSSSIINNKLTHAKTARSNVAPK